MQLVDDIYLGIIHTAPDSCGPQGMRASLCRTILKYITAQSVTKNNVSINAEVIPSLSLAPFDTAAVPLLDVAVACALLGLLFLFFGVVVAITLGGGSPGIETILGGALLATMTLPVTAGTAAGWVSSVKAE